LNFLFRISGGGGAGQGRHLEAHCGLDGKYLAIMRESGGKPE
jgi:hypothetical protein